MSRRGSLVLGKNEIGLLCPIETSFVFIVTGFEQSLGATE